MQRLLSHSTSPSARSFQVTLQFCLWDFFRELGEILEGEDDESHGRGIIGDKKVGEKRVRNVARAYAWWIAKGSLSLTVLKVSKPSASCVGPVSDEARFRWEQTLSFHALQPLTKLFTDRLISDIVLATQSSSPLLASSSLATTRRDSTAVERVFAKAAANESLGKGLRWYIQNEMMNNVRGDNEELLSWGFGVAKKTLKAGGRQSGA
jgi:nucleolar MIF4G domain-containing protein 1